MSIEALNCQCCGAPLKITDSVCECEYCSSINIVGGAAGKYITQLNRANKLRQQCDFDPAYNIYDSILSENTPSVDILWSQALCEYGIEYVPDPVSSRYFPTLHRIKDISFPDSRCFTEAMELADDAQKEQLKKSAEEIERIQKEYLNIASNEAPYDVFICYKETDTTLGEMTEDAKLAEELYKDLAGRGFKVFFARETLKDKLSVNYEPYIFAALKSSKAMAVIGTKAEYFTSVWVKNEWGRFLKLMETHPEKKMFFACDNPDDLPRAFATKQAQVLGEDGAIKNLAANIAKFLSGDSNDSARNIKTVLTQEAFDQVIAEKAKDYGSRLYRTKFSEAERKLMQEISDLNHTAKASNRLYKYSFHTGAILLISFALIHILYAILRTLQYNKSSLVFFHGTYGLVLSVLFFSGALALFSANIFLDIFNFKKTEEAASQNFATIFCMGIIVISLVSVAALAVYAFFPVSDTIILCTVPILILSFGFIRENNRSFAVNKRTFENAASKNKTLEGLEELAKKEFFEYEAEFLEDLKQNYSYNEAEIKGYHYDEVKPSVSRQIEEDARFLNKMHDFVLETKDRMQKRNIVTIFYVLFGFILSAINIMIYLFLGAYTNLHHFF